MANITRVGVDPKSGAQVLEQSQVFNENGDRNNTLDIFYHFGTRLNSSQWVNPNTTPWVNVEVYQGNSLVGPGDSAVDRDNVSSAFSTTDDTYNVRAEFLTYTFVLTHIYVRGTNNVWAIEASNDGTSWSVLSQGTVTALGDDYHSIPVVNGIAYNYYRIRHNQAGITKTIEEIRFYGTWNSGDFSFGIDAETQYVNTSNSSGGIIYIPDALVESFPDNYYVVVINNQSVNFNIAPMPGNTTTIVDNIGGLLKPNLQAYITFEGTQWIINLLGGGATELTTKGQLLTVDDNGDLAALDVGLNNELLLPDSTLPLGYKWANLFSTFAGTDPNKLVQLDGSSRLPAVDASQLTNLPIQIGSGSPLTTKGDLYTYSTVNTRLAIGSANSFLFSNPATATGLEWILSPSLDLISSPTTNFDFNNQRLTGLADPLNPLDAVNKQYADSISAGLSPKAACKVATTDDLDTETGNTWTATGGPGVGKQLIQTGVTTATIDGYSVQLGDRVLVKDQTVAVNNGIYLVTDNSTDLELTRATDFDGTPNNEVAGGAYTFIQNGTEWQYTGWAVAASGNIVVDTDPINFTQFSGRESLSLSQLSDVEDTLSPTDTDLLSFSSGQWRVESTGIAIGDIIRLVDVGGSAALPPLDGSNLTNLTVAAGQGSPLTTKGDIYIRDNSTNQRLAVGNDNEVLVPDSTTTEGLAYKEVKDITRFSKLVVNEGAVDKTTVDNDGVLDVFYFIGTLEGTDIWQNPRDRGIVIAYNNTSPVTNGNWFDRTSLGQGSSSAGTRIDLGTDAYLRMTTFSFLLAATYTDRNLEIRGGNDFDTVITSGEILFNGLVTGLVSGSWLNVNTTTTNSYRYFYFNFDSTSLTIRELEFYGEVTPDTAQYTLKAEDEKSILRVESVGATSIIAPTGLPEGYYTFVLNRDGGLIGVNSDGGSTIVGLNQSHNIGDVLMITNIGSDTWISSALSNVPLTNIGELITYGPNGVQVLPPPTEDNYRLTSLLNSETGLVWRPIESPAQILFGDNISYINNFAITSLDIIRYIGTNRNTTSFVNPGTSGKITVTGSVAGTITNLVDGGTSFLTFDGSDNVALEFEEAILRPTFIGTRINGVPSGTNTFNVQYSTNGFTWINFATFTIPDGGGGGTNLGVHIDNLEEYYKWFRIVRDSGASTGSSVQLSELKFFGDVIVQSPGGIVTIDSTGQREVINPPTYPKELRYDFDNSQLAWQGSEFFTQISTALGVLSFPGDGGIATDDLFEYLYDNNGSSNPAPSLVTVGTSFGASDILTLTDQNFGTSGFYLGGSINPVTIYVDLLAGNSLSPSYIGFLFTSSYSAIGFDVYGSNNGTTWTLLGQQYTAGGTSQRFLNVGGGPSYRYFRIERGTQGNTATDAQLDEMFFYGDYTNAGTIIETLATANMNRTNYLNLASPYQINIPDNTSLFEKGDYYRFFNTGLHNEIQIVTDPSVTLFGSISKGAKGVTIVNLDGDDNWVVFEDSSQTYGQTVIEATATADIELTQESEPIQVIDPGGANRVLVLPDPPFKNMYFKIVNTDPANFTIDIQETLAGSSIQTLDNSKEYVECHRTATQWILT